jgi:hypothetical protein
MPRGLLPALSMGVCRAPLAFHKLNLHTLWALRQSLACTKTHHQLACNTVLGVVHDKHVDNSQYKNPRRHNQSD